MNRTGNEIRKALEYCSKQGITSECERCTVKNGCRSELIVSSLDLINRQKAEIERLEIELKAMRGAANSYKAKNEALRMDYDQLQSDIINANQNNDHIKRLWETEKEKVAMAKQKVIDACKALQKAKAENEQFREGTKKIKSELKYYLDTNEENGVVWIPKFTVDNLVKELTEVNDNA